ncbi:TPA: transposase [Escherichia coli]|nr:transposase [Escherichia coli]EER9664500.1 transposase [Escherichia coli]EET3386998.1 transposase [Escherichia coli]EEX5621131.1 transposase [Escherichia coli]EFF1362046.1 transposase [Escherichia coli]
MFTEEEKIRAIELYFKYGKKLAPVVRELGYPSKRNLRRWIRSWEAGCGAKESIRHKHRYSDEQKQVAVEHYLNHGCCLAFTSRALGYPCTDVLARWVNEIYPDRRRIFTSKANPVAPFEPEVKRQAVMALCTRQVSTSEIARHIGVSRAVLYKWKDEIIGNSAYQTMRKHNEPSLEAERDALREEVARLNQEIRRRQMELDILKKAEEIIKKDPGISISHLNNREKTKIADALRQTYPLTELLHVLGLARSSYFYHRAALKAGDKYATIRMMLTEIFNSNYQCYGYRRRYSSYYGKIGPAPDNLIARDFKAEQPNQKWLTDITEFQLPAGKVWLSPVVDFFDRKVVSWSLSTRPDAELVNTMLDSAVETLNAGERPVIHGDRGGHYRWPGRLKNEMYYGCKWSVITPEKFMQQVDAYISWYNERRIKLSLGAVSPKMYRQQCGLE